MCQGGLSSGGCTQERYNTSGNKKQTLWLITIFSPNVGPGVGKEILWVRLCGVGDIWTQAITSGERSRKLTVPISIFSIWCLAIEFGAESRNVESISIVQIYWPHIGDFLGGVEEVVVHKSMAAKEIVIDFYTAWWWAMDPIRSDCHVTGHRDEYPGHLLADCKGSMLSFQ